MTDVFNREYSWAPSCKVYNESDRISIGIDSGAVRLGEYYVQTPSSCGRMNMMVARMRS